MFAVRLLVVMVLREMAMVVGKLEQLEQLEIENGKRVSFVDVVGKRKLVEIVRIFGQVTDDADSLSGLGVDKEQNEQVGGK